jgi:hypothetical protein
VELQTTGKKIDKKYFNNFALVYTLEKEILAHKNFFAQEKEPYHLSRTCKERASK